MYRGADPNNPNPAATSGTKFNLIKTFFEKEEKKGERNVRVQRRRRKQQKEKELPLLFQKILTRC